MANETRNTSKANETAKRVGLKGIGEVSEISGIPSRTLYDMANNNPKGYLVLSIGCFFVTRLETYYSIFRETLK